MNEIAWPEGYVPGFADNFTSNETIVAGASAAEVWPYLVNTNAWPTYYGNVAGLRFHDGSGPELRQGARLCFTSFGFLVEVEVKQCEPPGEGRPARLAWRSWVESGAGHGLDAYHAWLIEDLPGGRVRILTQATQNGWLARELAMTTPNPLINAHQEWITGLAWSARNKTPF